ncbi:ATP-binding protein [Methanoplanus sp. FWC-SCC4]|uniref:ATP-binding protein n=1 Tax=Methanochimaera problematica TaxID=2609417 RepID=A0AA97FDC0_9EURY|nr:ATP-binding protein [Methanoplanus sp. FWC-SCC4]WOF16782.1 ATP-binding protein [Methanoplanus sp. FWC-SCC4]
MGKKLKTEEILPSARRTMSAFRNFGYTFSSAVAEIVDNSIEAGANEVNININFDGSDSWITIADNGQGMGLKEITEAMRYGTERKYDSQSLGKFGMGLKTASLSQCRCLTVSSRKSLNTPYITGLCWDYDHIQKTNKWQAIKLKNTELNRKVRKPLMKNTGTVVMWERLDRIAELENPDGKRGEKRLLKMVEDLELHLGMVFHKYLSGEIKRKNLKICINGEKVRPWDPFVRTEEKLDILNPIKIPVKTDKSEAHVILEPFILPKKSDFSSDAAFESASGPHKWNMQQGFYIYRSGRMIQSGGWNRIRASDEHTKYARVMIDFPPELDEMFSIDVAKMRAKIPLQIRDLVKKETEKVVGKAKRAYGADMNTKLKRKISEVINSDEIKKEICKTNNIPKIENNFPKNTSETGGEVITSSTHADPLPVAINSTINQLDVTIPVQFQEIYETEIPDDEYFRLLRAVYDVLMEYSDSAEKKVLKEVFTRIPQFEENVIAKNSYIETI